MNYVVQITKPNGSLDYAHCDKEGLDLLVRNIQEHTTSNIKVFELGREVI